MVFRLNGVLKTSLAASVAALCIPLSVAQTAAPNAAEITKLKQSGANFVENKGQWNHRAQFLSRSTGMNFWVTRNGMVLDSYRDSKAGHYGHVLDMRFLGANPGSTLQGEKRTRLITQYLHGHQPIRTAHSFEGVKISDLYAGVDLRLYTQDGAPRYDLILAPGTDPGKVRFQVNGAKNLRVDSKGRLVIPTTVGDVTEQGLYAYQMVGGVKHQVNAKFTVSGNTVGYSLGAYDHSRQLVIDPIIYGSYYGGDSGADEVRSVVADSDGGVFMTGNTFAPDFPITAGPYGVQRNGTTDAFITKFQGDAYAHDYAAYFGGSGNDTGKFITLDPSGNNVWIAGTTSSGDLPAAGTGRYKTVLTGATDTFLFEWSKDQAQILVPTYSTYFGSSSGANGEELKGFQIGKISGNLFIAGETKGAGMPNELNAYPGASVNAFITRMAADGKSVLWTRYHGGTAKQTLGIFTGTSNTDANLSALWTGNSIAVDQDENTILTGTVTFSGNKDTSLDPSSYPTTPGVFFNGRLLRNNDIFVVKINGSGAVVYSALLGGADKDFGAAVATDTSGNAYVTGIAQSFDFPRTRGTFGQVFDDHPIVTLTKINQDGSLITYSTNLKTHSSPKGAVIPVGVSVDNRGFAFVTGMIIDGVNFVLGDPILTGSRTSDPGSIPVTGDAVRPVYTYPPPPDVPAYDGWLIVLDNTASTEIYGTYIGGLFDDGIFAPYNDRFGDVWVFGYDDLTRDYIRWSSAMVPTFFPQVGPGGLGAGFITNLAFKPNGETPNPLNEISVTTPYGILDESGLFPPPPATIVTGRARDGYVLRFRIDTPIVQSLDLDPTVIPGGLGATSTGTITLNRPASGAGVDVNVSLSDAAAASFDPNQPEPTIIVNIPAGQTTGTFTVYSNVVTDPTQVDIKAEYLGNFQIARLTIVPWLEKLTLSPSTIVGGNNDTGVITLAAPAPAGGVEVSLITNDQSLISFPGGDTVTVPAGQLFTSFTIATKGVDLQQDVTITASLLTVGRTQTLTLKPASLLQVSFNPGRVAGGTDSTGTVRLDGLPGPSGFNVDLTINSGTSGYVIDPTTLTFGPNDRTKDFVVHTVPENVNTQRIITATRQAQGTYTFQQKSGTLFIDANFLTNLVINPSTVNSGETSTGTVTISNTAQSGGVVVYLYSDNTAVAQVPASVIVAAGSTTANFTITTGATATDTQVHISASRYFPAGGDVKTRTLTVKGVAFTMSANPMSVIGGAQNITGTVKLPLPAPAGGVLVSLQSNNPGAASVPPSVTVPQGATSADFLITTYTVSTTQNVTITGQTQPGTTASVTVQIKAISLANLIVSPSVVKGGTVTHIQVVLDAPAPAGGATVLISSSSPTVIAPLSITIPAGQTQSASYTVPVARVNRNLAVTLTAQYNGRQIAKIVTVLR